MNAFRSVVRHRYIKGSNGQTRLKRFVDYITRHIEENRRTVFDTHRDDIRPRDILRAVEKQNDAVLAHILVLSPGVAEADTRDYARKVMKDLGSRKGLDLDWYAVKHGNTDNPHAHVVLMRKDKNGHRVTLKQQDYDVMKEAGDRYLQRNRLLDREALEKARSEKNKDRVDLLKLLANENFKEPERPSTWLSAVEAKSARQEKARRRAPVSLSRGGY